MNTNNSYLFLFTIGPVQSFIAQARKTQDLYTGSKILSELVFEGITALQDKGKVIFPQVNIKQATTEKSLPNRFVAIVEGENDLKKLAENITKVVQEKWKQIAQNTLEATVKKEKPKGFDEQIADHLDIHWTFHELSEDYKESYKSTEALLGAVKNGRIFEQFSYSGTGEAGRKCSLDGERNALFFGKGSNQRYIKNWNPNSIELKKESNTKIAANEGLSAVSFVKRFYKTNKFPSTAEIALFHDIKSLTSSDNLEAKTAFTVFNHYFNKNDFDDQLYFEENLNPTYFKKHGLEKDIEKLPNIVETHSRLKPFLKSKYYALIIFDGDKMGAWLSENASASLHPKFSGFLSEFAALATSYIDDNKFGRTIYAGGDDFLGFINLNYLFEVMQNLRLLFDEKVNIELRKVEEKSKPLYFSAGIAIAHYKTPLSEVLKTARIVEKRAKQQGGRNAFCLTVLKHSGETQETFFKWGASQSNWKAIEYIIEQLKSNTFSNKFINNLSLELYQLSGVTLKDLGSVSEEMITVEIRRLVKRALIDLSGTKIEREDRVDSLCEQLELLFKNRIPEVEQKDTTKGIENFVHALQIADFISRKIS